MSEANFLAGLRRWLECRAADLRREVGEGLHRSGSGETSGPDSDTRLAELRRDAAELERVVRALARAITPEFGLCIECELPIARERLAAEPFAERCFACEARRDRREGAAYASL